MVIKKLSGEKQLLIVFCKINKINENENESDSCFSP